MGERNKGSKKVGGKRNREYFPWSGATNDNDEEEEAGGRTLGEEEGAAGAEEEERLAGNEMKWRAEGRRRAVGERIGNCVQNYEMSSGYKIKHQKPK